MQFIVEKLYNLNSSSILLLFIFIYLQDRNISKGLMSMQQLFTLSVLILSSCGFPESGAEITLNLNINTNTDKGQGEEESIALVRDDGNRTALGRSLKRKVNIYRD